ncbi:ABC transporter ATP-binding protein [Agrobacterium rhizogenes]|uniref:ABC transporter ATP-binding protein n=1 Tax=Rhizobium rhizogenes TaxID=359 RepID=UPI0022B6F812|nr:ABC transporter ATP-binding protein [Rhizobium rhizogenes]MCZ7450282.1 ABC transporter ATP-binding protein [Rhizobium rhizogenes]
MAHLSIDRIVKRYATSNILEEVSLEVADGEFLTLLGPSGCGKSTLLRIIAGLDSQTSGSLSIGGRLSDGARPKERDVAMVFQSYALYPHMTVAANMALPLRMRRLSFFQRLPLVGGFLPGTKARVAGITDEVGRTAAALGIGHLLARKPAQLSGGQRQRVAVGRAMVRRPAVFLMDEPLSNLDAKLRVQMRAEIKDLHRRLGVTFIYVTHDQSEAMTMSDRVAVMLDGKLLQVAPPQEIYADPRDRRVAEFIGSPKIGILDATVGAPGLATAAGTVFSVSTTLAPGERVALGIRPEAFHLADSRGPNILSGRVRLVEHMGSDLFVHLDPEAGTGPVIARFPAERAKEIHEGEALHLGVRPERILVFDREGKRLDASIDPLTKTAPDKRLSVLKERAQ